MFTRRVTDATYRDALAVLGEQRLAAAATLAAYYELVSMTLNVDRYPLPSSAPPGAAVALAPLPQSALYRAPSGPVTARPPLPETDYDRAIESLLARLRTDAELSSEDAFGGFARRPRALEPARRQRIRCRASVAFRFASELLSTRSRERRDVRGGARRVRRAPAREPDRADRRIQPSLREARPRGQRVSLMTVRRKRQ